MSSGIYSDDPVFPFKRFRFCCLINRVAVRSCFTSLKQKLPSLLTPPWKAPTQVRSILEGSVPRIYLCCLCQVKMAEFIWSKCDRCFPRACRGSSWAFVTYTRPTLNYSCSGAGWNKGLVGPPQELLEGESVDCLPLHILYLCPSLNTMFLYANQVLMMPSPLGSAATSLDTEIQR